MFNNEKDIILQYIIVQKGGNTISISQNTKINHDTTYTICKEFAQDGLIEFIDASGTGEYVYYGVINVLPQARNLGRRKKYFFWKKIGEEIEKFPKKYWFIVAFSTSLGLNLKNCVVYVKNQFQETQHPKINVSTNKDSLTISKSRR